jgi:uncharacterized protein with HEPN domain
MTHSPSRTLRTVDCLTDIRDAIAWINRHIGDAQKEQFLADRKTQDSVIKNLVDIGEAANNIMQLDPGLEQERPDLWPHLGAVYDMRIKLTHGYRSTDALIVWNTARIDIPILDQLIAEALAGYKEAQATPISSSVR